MRHGPKAVIDKDTLVIYFFSNNEYVNRYEQDLVNAMKDGNDAMFCLGVSENDKPIENTDAQISFGIDATKIDGRFFTCLFSTCWSVIGFL